MTIASLLAAWLAVAPLAPPQNRPAVGLVLGGGGARGFAHIGVLEWFEENRIPVDYIAGASIGGLIGGLYAIGMTPAELRTVIRNLDWDRLLASSPSYDELSFRRKEDRRTYPVSIEFGLRNGLRLPRAINPGHSIGLIFDQLTLPYHSVRNFDDLPIPFRTVATDMINARALVLKEGSIAQALRATMAIPGLFAPAEINGSVLTDGGLLNNMPSDVVREMGAAFVVAVNAASPMGTRDDMQTLPGMLAQVMDVATTQGERRGLQLADIIIRPELGEYTRFDFAAGDLLADLGYLSAQFRAQDLQKLALGEDAWKAHLAARNARKRASLPRPGSIEVTGGGAETAAEIKQDLEEHIDAPLNPESLGQQLSGIRGGGRYESLGYELIGSETDARLNIRVQEKIYGPPFIIPVLQVQSRAAADVSFSGGFRMTHFDLGKRNSELRLDAIVGSNNLFAVEYYRPIHGGFFVAPRIFYAADRMNLYREGRRAAQYFEQRASAGLDAGMVIGQNAEVRAGYRYERLHAVVDVGDPLLPDIDGPLNAASSRFVYDGQDNAVAPSRGLRVASETTWYFRSPGATQGFPQSELRLSGYAPVSPKDVLFSNLSGGTTFNKQPGPAQQFSLGGPLRLSAQSAGEFRGSHYVLGAAGYRRQLGALPTLLGGKVYAGIWLERGSAFFKRSDADYQNNLAGALILETLLGPLTFGGAWGESGQGKMFFSFGRALR